MKIEGFEKGCGRYFKTSLKYTYVTMRSMKGKEYLEKTYKYGIVTRFFHKLFCGCCDKRLKKRYIYGNWPDPEFDPDLPDNINWENMGISLIGRLVRAYIFGYYMFIGTACFSIFSLASIKTLEKRTFGALVRPTSEGDCPLNVT